MTANIRNIHPHICTGIPEGTLALELLFVSARVCCWIWTCRIYLSFFVLPSFRSDGKKETKCSGIGGNGKSFIFHSGRISFLLAGPEIDIEFQFPTLSLALDPLSVLLYRRIRPPLFISRYGRKSISFLLLQMFSYIQDVSHMEHYAFI